MSFRPIMLLILPALPMFHATQLRRASAHLSQQMAELAATAAPAVSVWPAEGLATTPAPVVVVQSASSASAATAAPATTAAPGVVAVTTTAVAAQPGVAAGAATTTAAVPVAARVANAAAGAARPILPGAVAPILPIAGPGLAGNMNMTAPCVDTMNETAVVDKLHNTAQLSAQAAQKALEAILKGGRGPPSEAALKAKEMAARAAAVWEQALAHAAKAKKDAQLARAEMDTLRKVIRRGSRAYSAAINKVQIPPPQFPGNAR